MQKQLKVPLGEDLCGPTAMEPCTWRYTYKYTDWGEPTGMGPCTQGYT